jgi:hypothetical protein
MECIPLRSVEGGIRLESSALPMSAFADRLSNIHLWKSAISIRYPVRNFSHRDARGIFRKPVQGRVAAISLDAGKIQA